MVVVRELPGESDCAKFAFTLTRLVALAAVFTLTRLRKYWTSLDTAGLLFDCCWSLVSFLAK